MSEQTQPTRHPPEVIEAAKIASNIGEVLVNSLTQSERGAIVTIAPEFEFYRDRILVAQSRASKILRDALARAEADAKELENRNIGLRQTNGLLREKLQCAERAVTAECQRAEKAEAELAEAKRRIADDNKAYGCELMDPCGTIWDQCAKIQAELAAERQRREKAERELAEARKDKELLDTVTTERLSVFTINSTAWGCGRTETVGKGSTPREAINAAREAGKGGA